MKKLIVQIPCYNEEDTLSIALKNLPREIEGIECVEWLIIDDGSSDKTVEIAKNYGVHHIISHHKNLGLAKGFMTGLKECLTLGADIIVNTDADNQYCANCIPDLIRPILNGQAEMVIGARPIETISDFSKIKKYLQKIGSWTVRVASNTDIPDAPSGFRAIHKNAAKKLNVFSNYTYTIETIIQAGQKDIPITWVPIKTNSSIRDSRLVKSNFSYIKKSLLTIIRIFIVYRPFRFFAAIGSTSIFLGFLFGVRFIYYYLLGNGSGHVQSLILCSILSIVGFQIIMTAFIVDLISVNRRLIEEIQYSIRDNNG
jgi:glycosyltransferase involved in cell wall biosynthesis